MTDRMSAPRRRLLIGSSGLALVGALPAWAQKQPSALPSAGEELMQEHGLVGRVFGVYRAAVHYLQTNQEFDAQLVGQAARMMREVIHEHHEQEEENILFPRVRQGASANMTSLITVLIGQHSAARALTATVERNMSAGRRGNKAADAETIDAMQKFIAMYEPHGAFENSQVYPAFRKSMPADQYAAFGKQFAGDDFEKHNEELARIETLMRVGLSSSTEQKNKPRHK